MNLKPLKDILNRPGQSEGRSYPYYPWPRPHHPPHICKCRHYHVCPNGCGYCFDCHRYVGGWWYSTPLGGRPRVWCSH